MAEITLPWSMEQDRINQIKANSAHVDDNFNTLLNALNNKLDKDGTTVPTADLQMGNHKIKGLALPVDSGDATSRGYVDSAIQSSIKKATAEQLGQVKIGDNIVVNDGVISVELGKTNTISEASKIKIRASSISSAVPTSGEDGVLYFTYAA